MGNDQSGSESEDRAQFTQPTIYRVPVALLMVIPLSAMYVAVANDSASMYQLVPWWLVIVLWAIVVLTVGVLRYKWGETDE